MKSSRTDELRCHFSHKVSGHQDWVLSLAWNPSGKQLASGSKDHTIRIWDKNGRHLQTLKGHSHQIMKVAWSPYNQYLLSCSFDGTVKIWANWNKSLFLDKFLGQKIYSGAWLPNNTENLFLIGLNDGTIRLIDLDGETIRKIKVHRQAIVDIATHPGGKMFASCSKDNALLIVDLDGNIKNKYDLSSEVEVWEALQKLPFFFYHIAWSPDGEYIGAVSNDKKIRIWTKQLKLIQSIETDTIFYDLDWFKDSYALCVSGHDQSLRAYNIDGVELFRQNLHNALVSCVAVNPRLNVIASSAYDGSIYLWNLNGSLRHKIESHNKWITQLTDNSKKNIVISASNDKTIRLWTLDGLLLHTFSIENAHVLDMVFDLEERHLVVVTRDGSIHEIDFRFLEIREIVSMHQLDVLKVIWGASSNELLILTRNFSLIRFNLQTQRASEIFHQWARFLTAVRLPNENKLVGLTLSGQITTWSFGSTQEFSIPAVNLSLTDHLGINTNFQRNQSYPCCYHSGLEAFIQVIGESVIFYSISKKQARIYSVSRKTHKIVPHPSEPFLLFLDIKDVLTIRDQRLRIVASLDGDFKEITSLCWSSDGSTIIAGTSNGDLLFWKFNRCLVKWRHFQKNLYTLTRKGCP